MATEEDMWAAFREIDRRLCALRALRDHVEIEEEMADSAAFRAEGKMRQLGSKKRNLDLDLAEAHHWLISVLRSGATDRKSKCRTDDARGMLRNIQQRTSEVCEEARVVNDTRNRLRYEEECMELAGYSLCSVIEQLQCDLASVIAAGYSSG